MVTASAAAAARGAAAVALTSRDHQFIRAAWSLGWVTCAGLTALVTPGTNPKTVSGRLNQLVRAGYLRQVRLLGGPDGHVWLYGVGSKAGLIDDAYRRPWRPPLIQTHHTLAVEEMLLALHEPSFLAPLEVLAWQGEAELRTWAEPGEPYPDLRINWRRLDSDSAVDVEVDRGTQGRGAWQRKLARYLLRGRLPLLVLTTSDQRARNLAVLGGAVGVRLLALGRDDLQDPRPHAYDALRRQRRPLGQAIADAQAGRL